MKRRRKLVLVCLMNSSTLLAYILYHTIIAVSLNSLCIVPSEKRKYFSCEFTSSIFHGFLSNSNEQP